MAGAEGDGLLGGALAGGAGGAAERSGLGVGAPAPVSLPVEVGAEAFPLPAPAAGVGVELVVPVEDGVVDSDVPPPLVAPWPPVLE